MKDSLLQSLETRRPAIRARWEALLRLEKDPSPLGRPGALVFLFDQTLEEGLGMTPKAAVTGLPARPVCRRDCNPLRHYFGALEQALLEALAWAQSEVVALSAEGNFPAAAKSADACAWSRAVRSSCSTVSARTRLRNRGKLDAHQGARRASALG
jgi:hypothetical protein